MKRRFVVALLLCTLAGCAGVDIAEYRDQRPALDLAQFFAGTVDGWGMVQDRSGKVVKRFTVRIDATWRGDQGTLDEHFEYADGTREQRVWRLTRDGNRYTGTAGDVVGVARGETQGNALHWNYVLAVPIDGRTWHLAMDDWMYLVDADNLLNRTTMSKFGVEVGAVTLTLRRR